MRILLSLSRGMTMSGATGTSGAPFLSNHIYVSTKFTWLILIPSCPLVLQHSRGRFNQAHGFQGINRMLGSGLSQKLLPDSGRSFVRIKSAVSNYVL